MPKKLATVSLLIDLRKCSRYFLSYMLLSFNFINYVNCQKLGHCGVVNALYIYTWLEVNFVRRSGWPLAIITSLEVYNQSCYC